MWGKGRRGESICLYIVAARMSQVCYTLSHHSSFVKALADGHDSELSECSVLGTRSLAVGQILVVLAARLGGVI